MEPKQNSDLVQTAEHPEVPTETPERLEKEVCWDEEFTLSGGCCLG